ncbi:MAG TPA: ribonuclease III [Patescibacteria group bacterium]|nr:ribonuclease III [Patescibacteria group bacterium]
MTNIKKIEDDFKDKDLFKHALTHRSWLNEHKGERASNERLEFLGDAILEFVVSKEIYNQFPNKEEGYLTALRANLVNTIALSEFAKKLDLGSILFLSKGEEDSGGRTNPSLLADTVEAIIGAIFMDRGLTDSENFVKENLMADVEKKATEPLKDPKSRLQEYVQSQGFSTPKYKVTEESGPDHSKKFVIDVMVNEASWGTGEGKSKGSAEQAAALQALTKKVSP